ncbi:MAG: PVC-type heme-binding CxxCH protein [Aureliella sp.]
MNHSLPFGRFLACLALAVTATVAATSVGLADDFPEVFNTEAAGQHPPTPEEMVKQIELPPGFNVTLFAGEPDVQQPISMDFDDRGRLWVAENYTYSGGPYETKLRDRIVILEDVDGDGRHDSRKVFWDRGFMLTSLTWGFGGLWILNDGTLSFIPDKNGDDVPDSQPIVMLDGWSKECGHNFVSGLMWGPDGWLYGRHGIVDTSYPGIPGTPREERVRMNCGIWRFHPTKHLIEVVCNGTTNPWGLDYNNDGQFFMTNNVQGHLWHVIPGARFLRMYGQDFNPHSYELMDMTADHYHWDTRTKWNESRDGVANDLGGGHSHVGAMIYEGDNFPAQYRGKIFMCNTHGRRMNVDRLERQGSGYVGRHEPDFMIVHNPWFRGVDIKIGPDDVMFVSDWSDNGECHDHDGIHRTSGRIYRIAYGTPKQEDVKQLGGGKKFNSANTAYDWLGRHERRLAQEAAAGGDLDKPGYPGTVKELLHYEGLGTGQSLIKPALQAEDPIARAEAVHLAMLDGERRKEYLPAVLELASRPQPANVLLAFASALQKLGDAPRWQLARAMLACRENAQTIAGENNLTLMTWYGIEPVVFNEGALELLDSNPKLQQFAVRRMAYEISSNPSIAARALRMISQKVASGDEAVQSSAAGLLAAFKTGLAGKARVTPPADWDRLEKRLRSSKSREVLLAVDALAILFGDGAAIADLRKLAGDTTADPAAREQAIAALGGSKDAQSLPMFYNLLGDRAVVDAVIPALRNFDDAGIPKQLLSRFDGFKDGNKSLAIDTLSSRESYALELAEAIEQGKIDARELTAAQVRQLLALGSARIQSVLESKWGVVQETPEARLAAIEKWKKELTPAVLAKGNMENGAALFKASCANCHKIFGEGKSIAPDLTGSNRTNLEYLLINILDPSAVVPKQFTTSVVALGDGRVVTGVVVSETDQALVIQTDKEQLTIPRDEIDVVRKTGKSLMPDGMLDTLSPEQVRDLFAFLMRK